MIFNSRHIVYLLLCTASVACAEMAPNQTSLKLTKKEKILMRTGGWAVDKSVAKGKIFFLNQQLIVPVDKIDETIREIEKYTRCIIELSSTNQFSMADAKEVRRNLDADILIAISDSDHLPSIIFAPEENWGIININKLNEDAPGSTLIHQRLAKEMWRAFGYLSGACDSTMACVMSTVTNLKELDSLKANNLSPETMMRIEDHLNSIGIVQYRKATYKVACQEGWAHAPTNQYQQAVWDEVHSLPSNPMKIEFDPKKGR